MWGSEAVRLNLDLSHISQQPIPSPDWPDPVLLPLHYQIRRCRSSNIKYSKLSLILILVLSSELVNKMLFCHCEESCDVRSDGEEGGPWGQGPGWAPVPAPGDTRVVVWWSGLVQRQVMLGVSPLCWQSHKGITSVDSAASASLIQSGGTSSRQLKLIFTILALSLALSLATCLHPAVQIFVVMKY